MHALLSVRLDPRYREPERMAKWGQKKFGLVEEEIGGGADERIKPIRTLAKYLKVIN